MALAVQVHTSDAMSPVNNTRTSDCSRPKSSMTSIWRRSVIAPCNTAICLSPFSPRRPGSSSASQSSVAMRSEKMTTRSGTSCRPRPAATRRRVDQASTCGRPLDGLGEFLQVFERCILDLLFVGEAGLRALRCNDLRRSANVCAAPDATTTPPSTTSTGRACCPCCSSAPNHQPDTAALRSSSNTAASSGVGAIRICSVSPRSAQFSPISGATSGCCLWRRTYRCSASFDSILVGSTIADQAAE